MTTVWIRANGQIDHLQGKKKTALFLFRKEGDEIAVPPLIYRALTGATSAGANTP